MPTSSSAGHAANANTLALSELNTSCSLNHWSQTKKRKLLIEGPLQNIAIDVAQVQDPYRRPSTRESGCRGYECLSETETYISRSGSTTLDLLLELNLLTTTGVDLQSTQNPEHNGGDSSALTSEHLLHMADHESFCSRSSKSDDEVSGACAPEDSAAGPSSIMLFKSMSVSPQEAPPLDSFTVTNKLPKIEEKPPEELSMYFRSREISGHVKAAEADQRLRIMDRSERPAGWDALAAVTRTPSVLHNDGDWLQLGIGSSTAKPSSSEIHTLSNILEQPSSEAGVNSGPAKRAGRSIESQSACNPEASASTGLQSRLTDFAQPSQQKRESILKRPSASATLDDMNEWLSMESSRGRDSVQLLGGYVEHPSGWAKANTQEYAGRDDDQAADQRMITLPAASRLHWSHEIPSSRTTESDSKPLQPERFQLDFRGVGRDIGLAPNLHTQKCAAPATSGDHQSVGRGLGEGPEEKVAGIFPGAAIHLLNQLGSDDSLETDVHLAALKRAFPAAFQARRGTTQAGSTRGEVNVSSALDTADMLVQQQQRQLLETGSSSGSSHGMISLHHDAPGFTRNLFRRLPGGSSTSRPPAEMQQLDLLMGMAQFGQSAESTLRHGHGLVGGFMRNRNLSAIQESTTPGLWFKLQAAENQSITPPLHQITKYYLRVKDDNMPVAVVKKYLVRKLGLADESEVDISCNGQLLNSCLLLHNVRDIMWQARARNPNTPAMAATDHYPASIASLTGLIHRTTNTHHQHQHQHTSLDSSSTLLISPEDVTMVLVYSRAHHQYSPLQ